MRYKGEHPPQVKKMWHDVSETDIVLRQTNDIDRLLNSRIYQLGRAITIWGDYLDRRLGPTQLRRYIKLLKRVLNTALDRIWIKDR